MMGDSNNPWDELDELKDELDTLVSPKRGAGMPTHEDIGHFIDVLHETRDFIRTFIGEDIPLKSSECFNSDCALLLGLDSLLDAEEELDISATTDFHFDYKYLHSLAHQILRVGVFLGIKWLRDEQIQNS